MRFLQIAACASLLALTGCGHSAAKLARNADPRVCAASETTNDLFQILKEHVAFGPGPVRGTDVTGKELLDAITITVSNVTSKHVDKDALTVDCNATVHFAGEGVTQTIDQDYDYEVKPDLSDTSKVIVTVTPAGLIPPVEQMAGLILDAKTAKEKAAAPSTPAPAGPAAPTALPASASIASGTSSPANGNGSGDCSITVDGTKYLDIQKTCHIETTDGMTTINTDTPGPASYFAYISPDGKGGAQISWNSKDKWDKAEEDLGSDFHAQGSCWVNAKASVCAAL